MEMIMAVLFFCVLALSLFCFFSLQKIAAQNKKPTRLASGLEFPLIAVTTNSPLASYLGGTQNRNQYE
jgi:thiol:disulfide interchange protein